MKTIKSLQERFQQEISFKYSYNRGYSREHRFSY